MQLLDNGNIQLLRGEQHVDIAPPERRRNGRVKKRLTKSALRKGERLGRSLSAGWFRGSQRRLS